MTYDEIGQFDAFKKRECEGDYSYLKRVNLLEMFLKESCKSVKAITKFGHTYFRLHYDEIDELIKWVYSKRKSHTGKYNFCLSTKVPRLSARTDQPTVHAW